MIEFNYGIIMLNHMVGHPVELLLTFLRSGGAAEDASEIVARTGNSHNMIGALGDAKILPGFIMGCKMIDAKGRPFTLIVPDESDSDHPDRQSHSGCMTQGGGIRCVFPNPRRGTH
jgi:hypothetical protein